MQPLNRTKAIWDRQTRNEINENWEIIENNVSGSGNSSAEALNKANQALNEANLAKKNSDSAIVTANSVQSQLDDLIINSGTSDAEVVQSRGNFPNLRSRLDTQENLLQEGLEKVSIDPEFKTTLETESAPLGVELANSIGWTLGTGWSGNFSIGFSHSIGNIEPLVFNLGAQADKIYQVVFTVDSSDSDHGFKFNLVIGGSYPFELYRGAGNSVVYENGIKALSDGNLSIIPKNNFTGTIKNISIKEVIGDVKPSTVFKDKDSSNINEVRLTQKNLYNLFEGLNSGKMITSGNYNTVRGHGAGENLTSGYFNNLEGYNAGNALTTGSRNIFNGYAAGREARSAHRNIGIGTFALNRLQDGTNNIAIGADSLFKLVNANYNIALGLTSQEENVSGTGNISLGYRSLLENVSNNYNIVIGHDSGRKIKAEENTVIGAFAADAITTGRQNTIVGAYAMRSNIIGERNVTVGTFSGSNAKGKNNVFIGYDSAGGLIDGDSNIVIGASTTSTTSTRFRWLNIGNALYADMSNTAFGIGVENPTANLHIKANTAARPLLKFDTGVLTAVKNAGSFEYDGVELYFTKANGIRYKFMMEAVG